MYLTGLPYNSYLSQEVTLVLPQQANNVNPANPIKENLEKELKFTISLNYFNKLYII